MRVPFVVLLIIAAAAFGHYGAQLLWWVSASASMMSTNSLSERKWLARSAVSRACVSSLNLPGAAKTASGIFSSFPTSPHSCSPARASGALERSKMNSLSVAASFSTHRRVTCAKVALMRTENFSLVMT
jgi:hypothetical protein